jgi:DNA-binding NarL/FixJ family response regulator
MGPGFVLFFGRGPEDAALKGNLLAIRVLIVDDSDAVRDGLRSILARQSGISIVGEAVNGIDAIDKVERLRPDVVLVDAQMPEMDGIEATAHIKGVLPETRVLLLTVHTGLMGEARDAGADAYLTKDTGREELIRTIQELAQGEQSVT